MDKGAGRALMTSLKVGGGGNSSGDGLGFFIYLF